MPVDADISVKITIKSLVRMDDEPFRPSRTYSETFELNTDTAAYATSSEAFADLVYQYVLSEKLRGATVDAHFSITLSNATHPPVAKGVVPLAKGHRDAKLDHNELTGSLVVEDSINVVCADLTSAAKY